MTAKSDASPFPATRHIPGRALQSLDSMPLEVFDSNPKSQDRSPQSNWSNLDEPNRPVHLKSEPHFFPILNLFPDPLKFADSGD